MKKGTLIRNDAPHAVKMPEGSNVAARKVKKTAAEPAPQEPPTSPVARKSVNKKAIDMPPVKVPESIAVKPKPKPKVRPKAQAQPLETLAAKLLPAADHAPTPLPVPLDEAVLWEKDNPVKSRMAQLKARNAILEEQLQRLQSPFQARGKRP
jgi:hypothetical protein